ncbi:uncharacterized protein [Periplaneta americana]|uniref:uncharacterized protein n=1 Tax=Periplaneta americana TaxID=6978 RepID=UPI0037E81709
MWDPYVGKRGQGRPRLRWSDMFTREAGKQWSRTAKNRVLWRELGKIIVNRVFWRWLWTGGDSGTGGGRQLWIKYQSGKMHKLGIVGHLWTGGGFGTGGGRQMRMKYQSGKMHKLMFCLSARG